MWNKSRVTDQLGIRYPIIQGPFGGGISTITLTVAVSEAGGLGSFGMHHLSPAQIKETIWEIKSRTSHPFAANIWIALPGEQSLRLNQAEFSSHVARLKPYLNEFGLPEPAYTEKFAENFEDQIEAILEAKPPVFSFVFGAPSREILREMKKNGIKTIGAATTVDEALFLEDSGVDLIVASGSDAGGHRPSFLRPSEESLVGTFSLIPQIADAVRLPVIAAGGIADGRGIVAAFALGAEGVQLGTTFLATHESGASDTHKSQLADPAARYTALTRAFSGRFARTIRNRFMEEMSPHESMIPPYPIQNWLTRPLRQAAAQVGRSEYLSLWAGQAAALSRRRSASETFASLVQQTEYVFQSIFQEQSQLGGIEE